MSRTPSPRHATLCVCTYVALQLVGFQEEVQLREQDWGNFQVTTSIWQQWALQIENAVSVARTSNGAVYSILGWAAQVHLHCQLRAAAGYCVRLQKPQRPALTCALTCRPDENVRGATPLYYTEN